MIVVPLFNKKYAWRISNQTASYIDIDVFMHQTWLFNVRLQSTKVDRKEVEDFLMKELNQRKL